MRKSGLNFTTQSFRLQIAIMLLAIGVTVRLDARGVQITSVTVNPTVGLTIQAQAEPKSTHVLLQGVSVTKITTALTTNQADIDATTTSIPARNCFTRSKGISSSR